MQHLTHIADLGIQGVEALIEQALFWKSKPPGAHLNGALLGMLFFNPSLRTRVSFEALMARGGGHAVALDAGNSAWAIEYRDGIPMNGAQAEHVREAAPVLSRYVDLLAVRSFAALESDSEDEADKLIRAFREHATVPVISMESAREHLCQGLADLLTLRERFGATHKLPVTLTWAPHIKPLPKAVPNSFLLSAAAGGCDIRLAHPPGFELPDAVMSEAATVADATGGSISVTHDQQTAVSGSRAVYAKAWGPALPLSIPTKTSDDTAADKQMQSHPDWLVGSNLMSHAANDACLLHCLPVRRDVEVAAALLDSPASAVVDQAENRFHVQRVLVAQALASIEQQRSVA